MRARSAIAPRARSAIRTARTLRYHDAPRSIANNISKQAAPSRSAARTALRHEQRRGDVAARVLATPATIDDMARLIMARVTACRGRVIGSLSHQAS